MIDHNDKIELNWKDLTPINNIKNSTNPKRGVYCWGFGIGKQFMPYYIGIAENITFRIFEHINSIIGGKYTLFHKDDLLNFTQYKDLKESDNKRGKLYIPDWPKGYKEFIERRNELKEHIDYMIEHFTFSYAIVNESDYSKKELRDIEKKCIEQIEIKNLINTKGGKSDINIEHSGDSILKQLF